MSQLYLFNPENDLALANGTINYFAPANAMHLHNAGALIPIWICNNNDAIIASSNNTHWIDNIKTVFDINGDIFDVNCLSSNYIAHPWGWSQHARQQFISYGISPSILPSDKDLEHIRNLSNRRTSITILNELQNIGLNNNSISPIEAKNTSEVISFLHKHQSIYLKAPWSSSGRGVFNVSAMTEQEIIRQASGIIKRQGSIMCEKSLNKVKDFAILFHSNGSTIKYIGLSSFFNAGPCSYSGNIIDSQENIFKSIDKYETSFKIEKLTSALIPILSKLIIPHYIGYFGIDMMVYHTGNSYEIAPCIELNLRMTMGVVAYLWSQRHLYKGSNGIMQIEYKGNKSHTSYISKPTIIDKKLKSGRISIIPPDNYFDISIEVQ